VVIPGAIKIYMLSRESFSGTVLVLTLLTTVAVLLIARRPPFPPAMPWWRGFLQQKHLAWVKSMFLIIGGALLRIPFAGFVFSVFRTAFMWLHYFKGESGHFGLTDIFYACAHVYGAVIFTYQLQLLTAARNATSNVQLAVSTAIWVLWGLVIFSAGALKRTIYQRLLGLTFTIVPGVRYLPAIKDGGSALALVAMIVGAAFWIVGILNAISRSPIDPDDAAQDARSAHAAI